MFAIIIVLAALVLIGYVKKNQLQKENNSLSQQISDTSVKVKETNDLLNAPSKELDEKYARDKLGYGSPNEKIYIDISGR